MWGVDLLLSQEHPHQHIEQQVLDEEQQLLYKLYASICGVP
jgi:hypothetical protein